MHTELISIATDTLPLDGAFYLLESEPCGAVILFHGNTMNFYVGAPRFLPPVLTGLGFACLAFNRRGHDILSIRDSRAAEGAAFQLTKEGIEDNNYAARWLAERGFSRPVVIGHSNGGMLAVKHVSDHPETPAMVLLSAHGGGRDGVRRTSRAGMLAGDRLDEITAQARGLVAAGRGRELMLVPGWWYVISAESFLDRMTEMPDVLELAPTIRCPTLFIRGDEESPETYPAERFKERAGGPLRRRDRARLQPLLRRSRSGNLRNGLGLARPHPKYRCRGATLIAHYSRGSDCSFSMGWANDRRRRKAAEGKWIDR
jgi:pimeloyl-ACP methyl ester carboxylesterase